MEYRKDYLKGEIISTIYFGGGTPSLLSIKHISILFEKIHKLFLINDLPEITLEANPEDLNPKKLHELKSLGINRLSIGIQSFNNTILSYLNRIHTAEESKNAIHNARQSGFENINLDVIYAIRRDYIEILKKDLEEIHQFKPEHISGYSLTIEPQTVFGNWLKKDKLNEVPEEQVAAEYKYLSNILKKWGYDQYEVSNFSLPGNISKHNVNYWLQVPYLGIGPSAHSYNLDIRQFNIGNNASYIKSIQKGKIPATFDYLSSASRINERILMGLRTKWGCDLSRLKDEFGIDILKDNHTYIRGLETEGLITLKKDVLRLNTAGKLFADKIASDLFVIE